MMVCHCESGSQGITKRPETGCEGLRERQLHCQEERGGGNRQHTSIRLSRRFFSHKLMMGNTIFTEECNLLDLIFSYSCTHIYIYHTGTFRTFSVYSCVLSVDHNDLIFTALIQCCFSNVQGHFRLTYCIIKLCSYHNYSDKTYLSY